MSFLRHNEEEKIFAYSAFFSIVHSVYFPAISIKVIKFLALALTERASWKFSHYTGFHTGVPMERSFPEAFARSNKNNAPFLYLTPLANVLCRAACIRSRSPPPPQAPSKYAVFYTGKWSNLWHHSLNSDPILSDTKVNDGNKYLLLILVNEIHDKKKAHSLDKDKESTNRTTSSKWLDEHHFSLEFLSANIGFVSIYITIITKRFSMLLADKALWKFFRFSRHCRRSIWNNRGIQITEMIF
jgi:hypothetical protein